MKAKLILLAFVALASAASGQTTVDIVGSTAGRGAVHTQILALLTGLSGRTRPVFNITISNVPGPDKPLYFRGARLEAIYPASIVTHGQALNITCESYAGFMDFGFTGCHSSVPSLQKLAVYSAEALEELEAAILPKPVRKASAAKPKAPVKRRRSAATA